MQYCGARAFSKAIDFIKAAANTNSTFIPDPIKLHTESVNDAPPLEFKRLTPIRREYQKFKDAYPNYFVLMQVGDFYEVYGTDAAKVADILDIGLTKGDDPFTGFPIRSIDTFLKKFLKNGHSLVICDQKETEKKKFIREISRIVTPGTVLEDEALDRRRNHFLASISVAENIGISYIDISTGMFNTCSVKKENLIEELRCISPKEILVDSSQVAELLEEFKDCATIVDPCTFDAEYSVKCCQKILSTKPSQSPFLDEFTDSEKKSIGAIFHYIHRTQVLSSEETPDIDLPVSTQKQKMKIDSVSFKALEIMEDSSDSKSQKNSLFDAIDMTKTPFGARNLAMRLKNPLTEISELNERLDFIEFFRNEPDLVFELSSRFKSCGDCERSLQRILLSSAKSAPRDMKIIKETLLTSLGIKACLEDFMKDKNITQKTLKRIADDICGFEDLYGTLNASLKEDLPAKLTEGGIIQRGYCKELDSKFHETSDEEQISKLEAKYSSILKKAVKIVSRKSLGFVIESNNAISQTEFRLVKKTDKRYFYSTNDLMELKFRIEEARETFLDLEKQVYAKIQSQVINKSSQLKRLCKSLGELDVGVSLAVLSKEKNLCRPQFSSENEFIVKGGRHLVVENSRIEAGMNFCENDCVLTKDAREMILTGANMGGKSTFLRQNAIIAVLAQSGCFVPATSATLGITDAIFTRIGASDELWSNRSTFMVEMEETARILNQATWRSLVVLDEVGRGTSPAEGCSLALATLRYLQNRIKCRFLFATHYNDISDILDEDFALYSIPAIFNNGNIQFTHKIQGGCATSSHGIDIARLAGLPEEALEEAKGILERTKPLLNHHTIAKKQIDHLK